MSDKNSWYMGKSPLKGAGDFFFLTLLRSASEGEEARKLIGSFAKEVDFGLGKECPEPSSAFDPGSAAEELARANKTTVDKLYARVPIHSETQGSASFKKFGIDGDGDIPGLPVKLGVKLDYKKISTIDVSFGADSYFLELRSGFLEYGVKAIRKAPADFHPVWSDKDYMVVNRVLIVRNLKLTIKSKSVLSEDVTAGLEGADLPHIGLSFDKIKKDKIEINVSDGKDYLFGVSGAQPEKFKSK